MLYCKALCRSVKDMEAGRGAILLGKGEVRTGILKERVSELP